MPFLLVAILVLGLAVRCTDAPFSPAPAPTPSPASLPSPAAANAVTTQTAALDGALNGAAAAAPAATPTAQGSPPPAPEQWASSGPCRFGIEVADTPEEQARGLMSRISLPQERGMLFVYPQEEYLRFWMLNTLIPLDIIFLDRQGHVVDVQTMTPEPGVPSDRLTIYASRSPARYALEVNAGAAGRCGIAIGTEMTLHQEP